MKKITEKDIAEFTDAEIEEWNRVGHWFNDKPQQMSDGEMTSYGITVGEFDKYLTWCNDKEISIYPVKSGIRNYKLSQLL